MPPSKSRLPKTKFTPLVSVVIPGHNRPDSLRETLRALRNQTLSPKSYEVILIGFTGTSLQSVADENATLAKHFFVYKEISSRWPDAKRNAGIRLTRGKIVAFTDDDVLPQSDWLEKILQSFEKNPDALGVEGQTEGDNTLLLSHATKNTQGGEYPTCNLAFRKDILLKVGGFDEAYHFFREDTDIAYKVLQHGSIIFDPNVKVFHPTRKTTANSILRELGMTRGEIRLYKKFPKMYSKKYSTFLGLPGRGGWLQALFSWGIILLALAALMNDYWVATLLALAILFFFRNQISFSTRSATLTEKIDVFIHMLTRDLAYPFFFVYFWLTEKAPKME